MSGVGTLDIKNQYSVLQVQRVYNPPRGTSYIQYRGVAVHRRECQIERQIKGCEFLPPLCKYDEYAVRRTRAQMDRSKRKRGEESAEYQPLPESRVDMKTPLP